MDELETKLLDGTITEDSLIIVTLGKCGAGKSTLINKLIRSDEIIKLSPNLDTTKLKKKEEGTFAAIDSPGLEPSRPTKWVKVLKEVSKFGEGKARLVLLCIPVGPANKFADGTPDVMKYMQERMGKEVWKHCIVVFTFSYLAKHTEGDDNYKRYLQDYTNRFQEELVKLDVKEIKVVDFFRYQQNSDKVENTIVTIPAGKVEDDHVIPGSTKTWNDNLTDLIDNKCKGLTKFDLKKHLNQPDAVTPVGEEMAGVKCIWRPCWGRSK